MQKLPLIDIYYLESRSCGASPALSTSSLNSQRSLNTSVDSGYSTPRLNPGAEIFCPVKPVSRNEISRPQKRSFYNHGHRDSRAMNQFGKYKLYNSTTPRNKQNHCPMLIYNGSPFISTNKNKIQILPNSRNIPNFVAICLQKN